MQSRKSMKGISGISWFTDREPPPATFFCTKPSGMWCSKRRPGTLIG
jgi:hypothetical protein